MKHVRLSSQELKRVKRAADAMGFPWRPIAERPRVAREFVRRVEAELARSHPEQAPMVSTEPAPPARNRIPRTSTFVVALA